jgi:putative endonuclease
VGERLYHVYILASRSRVLYTGVTGNLEQRIRDHKQRAIPGFTAKYNVTRLVYCESFHDVRSAIAREKQIKGWSRGKRIALIESQNPVWTDLAVDWLMIGSQDRA